MMLLPTAIAAASLVLSARGDAPAAHADREGAEVPWFEGSFDELMARAREEERLVFLDFWTHWCGWCKRLERETFADPAAVEAVREVLCYSVDAESRDGAPVARRFGVRSYPTLLVLEPDGTVRDNIGGFLSPADFVAEIRRVQRDEGTFTSMRAALEARPDDLELRYAYAMKLRSVGDRKGFAEQMAALRQRDPRGETPTGRRIRFDELYDELRRALERGGEHDVSALEVFLAEETAPRLLFSGWSLIGSIHDLDARIAERAGRTDAARDFRDRSCAAYRRAWPHTPPEHAASFGNRLAWSHWLARAHLSEGDKAFALEVAKKAARAAGDDVAVIDTLACCYFMNGDVERAVRAVKRCIALEPDNDQWDERLAEFRAGERRPR